MKMLERILFSRLEIITTKALTYGSQDMRQTFLNLKLKLLHVTHTLCLTIFESMDSDSHFCVLYVSTIFPMEIFHLKIKNFHM